MKKHNYISKTVLCLLAISLYIAIFAGCQSQPTSSTSSQTNNSTTQSSKQIPNPDQIKKRIQDDIQPLITAGTITQDQANKIVDAMIPRNSPNSSNQSNGNQQNGTKGNSQRQRNNPLGKLASDGTITQAQAGAVMQKVRENSKHNNSGQSSQSSNNQSTSN